MLSNLTSSFRCILITIITLLICNLTIAQGSEGSANITYRPPYGKDGVTLLLDIRYSFFSLMGDPVFRITADAKKGIFLRHTFKGKLRTYIDTGNLRADNFSQESIDAIGFSGLDLRADVYRGDVFFGTMTFENVSKFDANASRDWGKIFDNISESDAKSLFKSGFELRNFRVIDISFYGFSKLNQERLKIEARNNIPRLLHEGRAQESAGNFTRAVALYREALVLDRQHVESKEALERVEAKIQKSQNQASFNNPASDDQNRNQSQISNQRSQSSSSSTNNSNNQSANKILDRTQRTIENANSIGSELQQNLNNQTDKLFSQLEKERQRQQAAYNQQARNQQIIRERNEQRRSDFEDRTEEKNSKSFKAFRNHLKEIEKIENSIFSGASKINEFIDLMGTSKLELENPARQQFKNDVICYSVLYIEQEDFVKFRTSFPQDSLDFQNLQVNVSQEYLFKPSDTGHLPLDVQLMGIFSHEKSLKSDKTPWAYVAVLQGIGKDQKSAIRHKQIQLSKFRNIITQSSEFKYNMSLSLDSEKQSMTIEGCSIPWKSDHDRNTYLAYKQAYFEKGTFNLQGYKSFSEKCQHPDVAFFDVIIGLRFYDMDHVNHFSRTTCLEDFKPNFLKLLVQLGNDAFLFHSIGRKGKLKLNFIDSLSNTQHINYLRPYDIMTHDNSGDFLILHEGKISYGMSKGKNPNSQLEYFFVANDDIGTRKAEWRIVDRSFFKTSWGQPPKKFPDGTGSTYSQSFMWPEVTYGCRDLSPSEVQNGIKFLISERNEDLFKNNLTSSDWNILYNSDLKKFPYLRSFTMFNTDGEVIYDVYVNYKPFIKRLQNTPRKGWESKRWDYSKNQPKSEWYYKIDKLSLSNNPNYGFARRYTDGKRDTLIHSCESINDKKYHFFSHVGKVVYKNDPLAQLNMFARSIDYYLIENVDKDYFPEKYRKWKFELRLYCDEKGRIYKKSIVNKKTGKEKTAKPFYFHLKNGSCGFYSW